MTKRLIDVDDDALAAARRRLGTATIKATVNESLRRASVDRALAVQRMLAAAAKRGRKVPDLLIAAAAEARSLIVLHYDMDFEHISSVTGQLSEWIVPAGTID